MTSTQVSVEPIEVPSLTDHLWAKLSPIIERKDPQYAGRPRVDPRKVFSAILYQRITGCAWNRIPQSMGNDSTIHRYYQRWSGMGLLTELYTIILKESRS